MLLGLKELVQPVSIGAGIAKTPPDSPAIALGWRTLISKTARPSGVTTINRRTSTTYVNRWESWDSGPNLCF